MNSYDLRSVNIRSPSRRSLALTVRSSAFGISSMKPETARLLPVAVAEVVGMLYSAWRHSGVIWVSQEAGTAARLERRRLDVRGRSTILNIGALVFTGGMKLRVRGWRSESPIAHKRRAT